MATLTRRQALCGMGGAFATLSFSGCLSRRGRSLTALESWPPKHNDGTLSFWTWQEYWGNQARAFKHLADLNRISRENLSGEQQLDRLNQQAQVDVVHVPSRSFGRMLEADLLQPLPVRKMPNWSGVDGGKTHAADFFRRDGEAVGVPQTPMMLGMIYHSEFIDEADSYELLWTEELEGRIAMPADPVQLGQIAALYTGQDPNDPRDFSIIQSAIQEQHSLVDTYYTDWMRIWRRFGQDELAAGVIPTARMCLCSQDGTPIRRVAPREGVIYGYSTLAIAESASNPWAGLEFINWSLDFKTGTSLLWTPDEWTLYPAKPLSGSVRDNYVSITEQVGIPTG